MQVADDITGSDFSICDKGRLKIMSPNINGYSYGMSISQDAYIGVHWSVKDKISSNMTLKSGGDYYFRPGKATLLFVAVIASRGTIIPLLLNPQVLKSL